MKKRRKRPTPGQVLALVLFAVFALLILAPLAWLVLTGFKTNKELFLDPWKLPVEWRFENYLAAWKAGIGKYMFNSILVTAGATLLSTLVSSMSAFALARYKFKSRTFWLMFIVSGLMLAPQASLIAQYQMCNALGIYNTRFAVILINSAFRIPFATFLIRGYFITISKEIEESAVLDGCGAWGIFGRIILPLSKPILGSAVIICVRAVWNDLMFSLVLLESDDLKTIPVGLMNMKSFTTTNWTVLIAGMVIVSVPLVILFLCLQKQFIRGLTAGSTKG
ncbi:ABC transporter permease [Oscillospiraceae bacterium]|nr:ABC transporter permease [Oscillospiraceae bacterium]